MPHDDHQALPTEPELRLKALEEVLTRKGLVDPEAIDEIIDLYSHEIGPRRGAELVAKCWTTPAFKAELLADTTAVLDRLGLSGRQGEHVRVVENTPEVHNMVVCTLCSCYPWPLLGVPPAWYKSDAYRSRAVREPRKVLEEFGVELTEGQSVQVWDSTAEIRYLVLPMQPAESRGLDESELAGWITRDSMVGTGQPCPPRPGGG